MTDEIRKKIYNIHLVVEEIKDFPQTYDTILGELRKDGTCQTILRRKLNILCKDGKIGKTSIPGTRFGKAIFYSMPKDYHILVEGGRLGSNVYCFFKYKKVGRYYLRLDLHWKLEKGLWEEQKKRIIFEGNVLKWI